MRTVEYWRWRYRNVETGQICRTMFPCSVEEAKRLYPGAERIEETLILREVVEEPAKRRIRLLRSKPSSDTDSRPSDAH